MKTFLFLLAGVGALGAVTYCWMEGQPLPPAPAAAAEPAHAAQEWVAPSAFADRLPPDPSEQFAASQLGRRLAEQVATVFLASPESREIAWNSLVASYPAADLQRILEGLVNAKGPELSELRKRLLQRWVSSDPLPAGRWAAGLSDQGAQKECVAQIAEVWSQADLPKALAWVDQLPAGQAKSAAVVALSYELVKVDPVEMLSRVAALPPGKERDDLLLHGVNQWSATDPAGASDWALQITDERLRARILGAVATTWASSDPVSAANFAVDKISAGPEQDNALVGIVQRWGQTAPESTAKWLEQFPDLPVRNAAEQNLVSAWVEKNPQALGEWLRGLPPGALRDEGICEFAKRLAPFHLQEAKLWAASIQDASVRGLCDQGINRFSPAPQP